MTDLPPNFVLECGGSPSAPPADPLAAWETERAAHGALGYAASFALDGAGYKVTGRGELGVTSAPFTLRMNGNTQGLFGFLEAEVEGIEETGRVELYVGSSSSDYGHTPVSAGSIEGLALKELSVESGVLDGKLDLVAEQLGPSTQRHHTQATVSDLALDNGSMVYLYPEGSFGLDGRVAWIPTGPVVVNEASDLYFGDDPDVSLQRELSDPLEAEYEAFGVAGDFTGGTLEVPEREISETPLAIFGATARLRATESSLESVQDVRVTQAVNEAGLMIPAAVEIAASVPEVWVRPNESVVIELYYRERSYGGDAVLGSIQIGGDAESLLELQTGFMPTLTAQIIDAVIDTGWAAPLIGLAALPVVSIVFVIDIFECIFGGCAAQPHPLKPFPQWMTAGEIGTMELRVKGKLGVGTYQTSVTFVGRNYCPVTVPLTVHVGEPPIEDAN